MDQPLLGIATQTLEKVGTMLNAIDQAQREINTRYDLKDSKTELSLEADKISINTSAVKSPAMIQKRTITVVSGHPPSSKWWWRGAIRNGRRRCAGGTPRWRR